MANMIATNTIAVENKVADNMYERSEWDYTIKWKSGLATVFRQQAPCNGGFEKPSKPPFFHLYRCSFLHWFGLTAEDLS